MMRGADEPRGRRGGIACALGLAGAWIVVFFAKLVHQPPAQEELTWWLSLARSWASRGVLLGADGQPWNDHFPLYAFFLGGVFRLAGDGVVQARALGLAIALITMVAFAGLAEAVRERGGFGRSFVLLAVFVYAVHPLVLQSLLAIEPDTTLGPLAVVLFAYAAITSDLFRTPRSVAIGGLLLAWLGCVKLYLVPPAVVALGAAIVLERGWTAAIAVLPSLGLVAGIGLALVWVAVALVSGMSLDGPWRYLGAAAATRLGASQGVEEAAKTVIQLGLWLSPVLVVVAAVVLVQAVRRRGTKGAGSLFFLALWALVHVAVLGYGIGVLYGFPKYEAPIMPLLLLAFAGAVYEGLTATRSIVPSALAVAVGAGTAIVGSRASDPLLFLRIHLKEVMLTDPATLTGAATRFVVGVLALIAVPAAVVLVAVPRTYPRSTVVQAAVLASYLGLSGSLVIAQFGADYVTRYGYGERGTAEVSALLRRDACVGRVIAPLSVTNALGTAGAPETTGFWDGGSGALATAIPEPHTCAVIWSLGTHTVRELRYLESARVRAALVDSGYSRHRIGTFVVWARPPGDARQP